MDETTALNANALYIIGAISVFAVLLEVRKWRAWVQTGDEFSPGMSIVPSRQWKIATLFGCAVVFAGALVYSGFGYFSGDLEPQAAIRHAISGLLISIIIFIQSLFVFVSLGLVFAFAVYEFFNSGNIVLFQFQEWLFMNYFSDAPSLFPPSITIYIGCCSVITLIFDQG